MEHLKARAKELIIGDRDYGQYLHSTGTILPKRFSHLLEPLFDLMSNDIVTIDIGGFTNSCVAIVTAATHEFGLPPAGVIVQTAVLKDDEWCVEVRAAMPVPDEIAISKHRMHKWNDFPTKYFGRIARMGVDVEALFENHKMTFVVGLDGLESIIKFLNA